jgi:hypothetical protein
MKLRTLVGSLVGLIVSVSLLAGCQTTEPAAVPEAPAPVVPAPAPPVRQPVRPPAVVPPQVSSPSPAAPPSVSAPVATPSPTSAGSVSSTPPAGPDPRLTDGITSYDLGDYNNAIRKLNIRELLENPSLDVQIEARKYLAFSYCVTRRAALCKQQFDAALKSKPSFDLRPIEAGHPSWGPVFKRAKADALKK